MKTRKILAIVACAMLLIAISVAGTLAYINVSTGTVTNTFTVGKITLTLDETKVNEDGEPVDKDDKPTTDPEKQVKIDQDDKGNGGNTYKLVPDSTYTKDPTVYVGAGSEKCYVFVKVVNGIEDYEDKDEDGNTIAKQLKTNGWEELAGVDDVYYQVVDQSNETKDLAIMLFKEFTIDAGCTSEDLAKATDVTVTAYAIQYANIAEDDGVSAWEALGK